MKNIWWYVVIIGTVTFAFATITGLYADNMLNGTIITPVNVTIGTYTTTLYKVDILSYLKNLEIQLENNAFNTIIESFPTEEFKWAKEYQFTVANVILFIPKFIVNSMITALNIFIWVFNIMYINITMLGRPALFILNLLGLNQENSIVGVILYAITHVTFPHIPLWA